MKVKIIFDKKLKKSLAFNDNIKIGECFFLENQDTWNIVHTEVDQKYQGNGIARLLVELVIENAEKNNKKLMADCSYAKRILENNSQYE